MILLGLEELMEGCWMLVGGLRVLGFEDCFCRRVDWIVRGFGGCLMVFGGLGF